MEKLVKLLNKYIKDKNGISGSYELEIDNETGEPTGGIIDSSEDYFEVTSYYITMKIISKRFGFIERLVKNDKIDLDMIPNVFTSSAQDRDEVYYCMRDIKDFSILNEQYGRPTIECLLMLLSIQENPLEYLCSILKE